MVTNCLQCFAPLEAGGVCPKCGFDNDAYAPQPHHLPPETILHGRYAVGKSMGEGGFGITYAGNDLVLLRKVAIKEYFPGGAVWRDPKQSLSVNCLTQQNFRETFEIGRQKCIREAQSLAKLDDIPAIVRILDFFEENNTAYIIMEFVEGVTLKDYVRRLPRKLRMAEIVNLLRPVTDALESVHHRGFVHRDVSPDNIMIAQDGTAKLLDFGAVKSITTGGSATEHPVVKRGFSPLELYSTTDKIGTWTDVYALAATIVYLLTGAIIDEPSTRLLGDTVPQMLDGCCTPQQKKALLCALSVQPQARQRNVAALMRDLTPRKSKPEPEPDPDDMKTVLIPTSKDYEAGSPTEAVWNTSGYPVSDTNRNSGYPASGSSAAPKEEIREKMSTAASSLADLFSLLFSFLPKPAEVREKLRPLFDKIGVRLSPLFAQSKGSSGETVPAQSNAKQKKTAALIGCGLAGLILIWLCLLFFWDNLFIGMGKHADGFLAIHYILAGLLLAAAVGLFVYGKVKKKKLYLPFYLAACAVLMALSFVPIYSLPHMRVEDATLQCYSPFYKGEISIPSEVTQIGASAFEGSDINTITIPEGVTSIEDHAFRNCAMTSVILPESLRSIGEEAFAGSGITSISLPTGLSSVGTRAFADCGISSVVLPRAVTTVGKGMFEDCDALVSVTLSEETTAIEENAFAGCESLRDITLPVTVKQIGQKAFSGCTSLAKIVLPNTIETIEKSAFNGCKALSKVNIPTSVTKIENEVFSGCESLQEIKFPRSVTQIGEAAFRRSGLTIVSIPETITRIGTNAFQYCASLGRANVPRGIRLYGDVFPSVLKPTWYNAHRLGFISAGERFTTALRADGSVAATGENKKNQIKVGDWKQIIAVAAGKTHTIGLHADGTVVATGDNAAGQCKVNGWKNIVMIAAGANHSVGLRSDGTVVAVGQNTSGECNVKDWTDIVAIAAGFAHTVGLKADGTVVATGYSKDNRCKVSSWTNIVSIAANNKHTVGLRADGTVVAAGDNEDGQCDVGKWKNIVAVAAGYFHTVGLKSDGTVVAAGFNSKDGRCNVKDWRSIVAISAGDWHTIGLRSDGTIVAVGNKKHNQCNVSQWNNLKLPPV